MRVPPVRHVVAALLCCAVALPVAAQMQADHPAPKNLKVLPKDISHDDLIGIMRGFTDALGVRCTYCHVGEEGKPMSAEDFAKDDKPEKDKARAMMRMTHDINEKYLATLPGRGESTIEVRCATCHHGAHQPRALQDVLQQAYDRGGIDSTLARFQALRETYYGRYTYDFGDGPLNELAMNVSRAGHPDDAMRLLRLNLEEHPASIPAQRQLAIATLLQSYRTSAEAGDASYREMHAEYGDRIMGEDALMLVGRQLAGTGNPDGAIAALQMNVSEHPQSTRALALLGEAYAARGDRKAALKAFQQAISLDPANSDLKARMAEIKAGPKKARQ